MPYPVVRIQEGHDRRLRAGSPWLYSNELVIEAAEKQLERGQIVRLTTPEGRAMALAFFNPHSLIAARILSRNTDLEVDRSFLERRLRRALVWRDRLSPQPFYRLVHAEADGLPGLVVDRYGGTVVAQANTAGMARLRTPLIEALQSVLGPDRIILRDDDDLHPSEAIQGGHEVIGRPLDGPVGVIENGLTFQVDLAGGQKTGWYYDQGANRAFAAKLAHGASVLDLYSYAGGFGLTAMAAGAASTVLVDSSGPALDLAQASARAQDVAAIETRNVEAFTAADALARETRRFGLVVADPPPFVRVKKDLGAGLKGYQKLARLAAPLVDEQGALCISCCSHNVPEDEFLRAVYAGIRAAGRGATLLHRAGAGPDHPVHPALPESAYLKFLAFSLD